MKKIIITILSILSINAFAQQIQTVVKNPVTIEQELAIYHKNTDKYTPGVGYYDAVKVLQKIVQKYRSTTFDRLAIDSNSRHGLTNFQGICDAVYKAKLRSAAVKMSFRELTEFAKKYDIITVAGGNALYCQVLGMEEKGVRVYFPGFANPNYLMPTHIFQRDWNGKAVLISDKAIDTGKAQLISTNDLLLGDGCENTQGFEELPWEADTIEPVIIRSGKLYTRSKDISIQKTKIPLKIIRNYRANTESEVNGWVPDRVSGSSWAIKDGIYDGQGHITTTRTSWTNVSITTKMRTIEPGQSVVEVGCIDFNYTDVKNRYNFFIGQGGYLFIGKYVNSIYPTSYIIDGLASNIDPTAWNNVKIEYNAGRIKVYINNNLMIDVVDSSPLPDGKVALESHLSHAQFGDTTVQDASHTLQNNFATMEDDNNYLFGYGYTFNYGIAVKEFYSQYAIIYRPSGRKDRFTKNADGSFTSPFRVTDLLTKTANGYTLKEKTGREYHFDNTGKLLDLTDTNNNVVRITYTTLNGKDKPLTVSDSFGHSFNFTYASNGMVNTVKDNTGREVHYSYNGNKLVSVVDPAGNQEIYSYHPLSGNLVSITDKTGKVYEYSYLYNDQIKTQKDPNKKVTFFDYLGYTTVISNDKLESQSYDFFKEPGELYPLMKSDTDRKGMMEVFKWDGNGNLTEKIDRNNNHFSFQYDSLNNITLSRDPQGNEKKYTYDPLFNKISSMTDERGNITQYQYDQKGNLTKINLPGSSPANPIECNMTYTQNGFIDTITDPRGNTIHYNYDQYGNIAAITDAQNKTLRFSHDAVGRITSYTDKLGNSTNCEYNDNGNLTKLTTSAPFSYTALFEYNGNGNLIRKIMPNGKKIEYDHDQSGNITSIKNYTDDTHYIETKRAYDSTNFMEQGKNLLTESTDPEGNTKAYAYDESNRLTKITDSNGKDTCFEYDNENNITKITDSNGNQTKYTYTGANRLVRTDYANGTFELFNYDSAGNVISKTDRNGAMITYGYDLLNRLTTITYPNNSKVIFAYDKSGNIIQMTDSTGTTTYVYDNLNRLQSVTYPGNKIVSYEYDANNNITHIHYPAGDDIQYQYDQLNRNTDIIKTGQVISHFVYDNLNRRIQKKLGNNIQTDYSYDNLNRLTSINSQLSTINYSHDNVGNITKKTTLSGAEDYQYDNIYQLTNVTIPDGRAINYGYDDVGNRLTKDQNSISTAYIYNNVNQLTQAANNGGQSGNKIDVHGIVKDNHTDKVTVNGTQAQISGNTFTANNIPLQPGQNTLTVIATDQAGNTTTQQKTVTLANEASTAYQYDNNGNLMQKTVDGKTTSYTYDYENRLIKIIEQGTQTSLWEDNLNPPKSTWVGNSGTNCSLSSTGRVQVISNTPQSWGYVVTEPISLTVDSCTTLEVKVDSVDTGANYTLVVKDITLGTPQPENTIASQRTSPGVYTSNLVNAFGQQGNRKYLVYIWAGGGAGKGVQVDYVKVYTNQGGLAVDYVYDGVGRRIQKSVNGVITKFVYDRNNLIEEYNSSGQRTKTNIFSLKIDEPIRSTVYSQSTTDYYYSSDHLGSVTEITDSTGALVEKYTYDPYGKPTIFNATNTAIKLSAIGNNFLFTGREWDSESNLYFYRARFYDPKIGRFISADPIKFKGGVNFYAYVLNNPMNAVDPMGLAEITVYADNGGWFGHTWIQVTLDNGVTYTLGNYPDGINDDSNRISNNRDSNGYNWEHYTWEVSNADAIIAYNTMKNSDNWHFFWNNCTDSLENVLDAVGISYPDFDDITGVSDPMMVYCWLFGLDIESNYSDQFIDDFGEWDEMDFSEEMGSKW